MVVVWVGAGGQLAGGQLAGGFATTGGWLGGSGTAVILVDGGIVAVTG